MTVKGGSRGISIACNGVALARNAIEGLSDLNKNAGAVEIPSAAQQLLTLALDRTAAPRRVWECGQEVLNDFIVRFVSVGSGMPTKAILQGSEFFFGPPLPRLATAC